VGGQVSTLSLHQLGAYIYTKGEARRHIGRFDLVVLEAFIQIGFLVFSLVLLSDVSPDEAFVYADFVAMGWARPIRHFTSRSRLTITKAA
jgi:hypothetical protein